MLEKETPSCRALCGTGQRRYHPPAVGDSFSSERSHWRKVIGWASSSRLQWLPKTNPNYGLNRIMRTSGMSFFTWAIWAQPWVCSARLRGGCLSEAYRANFARPGRWGNHSISFLLLRTENVKKSFSSLLFDWLAGTCIWGQALKSLSISLFTLDLGSGGHLLSMAQHWQSPFL